MSPLPSEDGTRYRAVAGQPASGRCRLVTMACGLLVPCLVWAGSVVIELGPTSLPRMPAAGVRAGDVFVSPQSPYRRYAVAVAPLSRVTEATLTFCPQTIPGAIADNDHLADEVSPVPVAYRECSSGGLAYIECWGPASERAPDAGADSPGLPARLQVSYEPLPRAERVLRGKMLRDRAVADEPAPAVVNPTDVEVWYAAPETSLSALFGGDPVPYDFSLSELAEVSVQNGITVVALVGGWGYAPIDATDDILPIVNGIRHELSLRGVNSILVPSYRAGGSLLGRLRALSEMCELYHGDAERLAVEVSRFLSRQPRQRVVLVGMSNGAALADGVMNRLPRETWGRVCAIEIGPPLMGSSAVGNSVLRLDNQGRDPLIKPDYWALLGMLSRGLWRTARARLAGREYAGARAYHCPDHDYRWPAVRPEIVTFLRAWERGRPSSRPTDVVRTGCRETAVPAD